MPRRFCVGPVMAVDWGDDQPHIDRHMLARVFGYFRPYWRRGGLALVCIAVSAALGLVPALIAKDLIDYLARANKGVAPLLRLVAAGVAASIGLGLIGVAQSFLTTTISEGIMFRLREQLFDRLLRQSVGFFTASRSGDLMSRLNNDVGGIQDVVSDTIFGLITSVAVAATTIALMLALSWQLTLAALVIMPLVLIPSRFVGRVTYRARERTQERLSAMSVYMQEILGISGMLLVKAFTKEDAERRRFADHNTGVYRAQVRQAMIDRGFGLFGNVMLTLGPALLLLLGGYLVVTGRSTIGTVISVITILAGRLAGSMGQLAGMYVNVTGSLALFQRIFQSLDHEPDVSDQPGAVDLGRVTGLVTFEDVRFGYPGTGRPALDGVSFSIEPGQLVALVGPSGAGKTTVTSLLSRFYDVDQGAVRIDGQDVRGVTLASLSANMGIVFQDSYFFHTTIRENLLYARPDATQDEIEAAARAANIHDFIVSLPDGYDTTVGERGHRLSGGEKQRLSIVRAILKDPRIVVLDEATSNLDTISERLIQEALRPLFAGRTAFVIAHRLSTVLAADVILVFDEGHLVERGTHFELVRTGGLYAELCERQLATA